MFIIMFSLPSTDCHLFFLFKPSHEIAHIMAEFLQKYWQHLKNEHSGDHLFVVSFYEKLRLVK